MENLTLQFNKPFASPVCPCQAMFTVINDSNTASIEIDNDIASGRDIGVGGPSDVFDPALARGMVLCPVDHEYYPIYVRQNMSTVIEPIYHVVYSEEFEDVHFDMIQFVTGLAFEENLRDPIYGGNALLIGTVDQVGDAHFSPIIGACGVISALTASVDGSFIRVICEKTDDGQKRARVYAGFVNYQNLVANMDIPLVRYFLDGVTPVVMESVASNAVRSLYKTMTGEEGELTGIYDIKVTLDPERSNARYCSQLWVNQDGKLMEYPLVYTGDQSHIVYYPISRPFGEQNVYDLTSYWEGNVPASETTQALFDVKELGSIIVPD